MSKIKLIDKYTDISKLKMSKYNWDVVVNGVPYQVVRIERYVHSIGGKHSENDLWMYPLSQEPSYKNLVEYNCDGCGVCWGIRFEPHNYKRTKYDETECFTTRGAMITRNGEDFYFCNCGIDEARYLIPLLSEHPLNLNERDFDSNMIGRKIWWRSEPAIIKRYVKGQAAVIIEPDGINKFTTPAEFADEGSEYYDENWTKTDIFDKHIWWFRD